MQQAETIYSQILAADPGNADANHLLGVIAHQFGNDDKAVRLIRKAIRSNPKIDAFHNNLGKAQRSLNRLDKAVASYRKAIAINPNYAEAHCNLGNARIGLCQLDRAIPSFKRAIAINPSYAEAHCSLGAALQDKGQLAEAVVSFKEAITIDGNYADAYSNLGVALQELTRLDEAVTCFTKALEIDPDYTAAHSNLLFAFNYHPELCAEDVFDEYQRWNEQHAKPLLPAACSYSNHRTCERKLKIGYISPDFKTHSAAYFFEPLLEQHDRTRVEIYCYSNVKHPDAVTRRLRESVDHWCSIVGKSDQSAADQIRHDEIDILVELAGHTENNRLLVLARKPAPVQVTWLGYPNTTGLEAIDYRLTDEIADPVGLADELHSEELIRLENGFLPYQGIESASAISALPCSERGFITFGSFNNLTKVVPEVVSLWSKILRAVPDAHLLLKSRQLADGQVRDRYLAWFKEGQISSDRIELHSKVPSIQDHLQLYSKVDIGLDPFPYNGTTTTCEALWMGVPVITLAGDLHAGRVGASLLNQVGLDELIAADSNSYLDAATRLAEDRGKLTTLRLSLREMMIKSELCNATAFARKVEDAYGEMWKKYLSKSQG